MGLEVAVAAIYSLQRSQGVATEQPEFGHSQWSLGRINAGSASVISNGGGGQWHFFFSINFFSLSSVFKQQQSGRQFVVQHFLHWQSLMSPTLPKSSNLTLWSNFSRGTPRRRSNSSSSEESNATDIDVSSMVALLEAPSPCFFSTWDFKLVCVANALLSQRWHKYGFSPVWTLAWVFRWWEAENFFSQLETAHLKDTSDNKLQRQINKVNH